MESANGRLSEDTLRKHFSNYGEVEEALILSNNDRGNERGFGYVTFKDPAVRFFFLFWFLSALIVFIFIPVLISFFYYYWLFSFCLSFH